jgi:predicted small secreted protein
MPDDCLLATRRGAAKTHADFEAIFVVVRVLPAGYFPSQQLPRRRVAEASATIRRSPMRLVLKTLVITALILAPLALSACNTVKGAGQDTKDAGEGIKKAAS